MSRARATALALVNWKGVFYERYQLDRRVTALEGSNGAGKTTVMIAAYIVLLPDMSRLRFTNLGETAAIGGDRGIWGRLGEASRPSYAAMELDLGDGGRVIAGVLLTRKAEPTLELTPFLIKKLEPAVRLQQLLLLTTAEEESVPELGELKQNVAAAGGEIEVFSSAKDYFAALFELGVGALRLASEEDRSRLGDMLRTSMTGGISRAITAELRSFLLREQGSIEGTLGRMRENLNACRRTRLEVSEAQLLEQEISGIYDAGQGMFGAALQATRELCREYQARSARLGELLGRAQQAEVEAERRAQALRERGAQLAIELEQAQAAQSTLREQARQSAARESLRAIWRDVEQERAQAAESVEAAQRTQRQASNAREAEKQKREIARQDHERAARGLSHLQDGLDELYRRSSAFRSARRLLARVVELEGEQALGAADLPERLARLQLRLAELDAERLAHERNLSLAAQRQQEWSTALGLLGELGHDGEREPHEFARERLQQLESLRQGLLAQGNLRSRLKEIQRELAQADAELGELDARRLEVTDERRSVQAERALTRERLSQTQASLGKQRRLLQRVERIAALTGPFAPSREAILRLRDATSSERQELSLAIEHGTATRERLLHDANQMEASGGQFPAALLKLRDELEGELLGNRFEELDPKEAARLEAVLGPLTQAVVVDDLEAAAERLRDKPRELSELRLVAAGTDLAALQQAARDAGSDVHVLEGRALRVTRRPEKPSLGRKAREARVLDLRREAARLGEELETRQLRLRGVKNALAELDQLLPDAELLEKGDPERAAGELTAHEQALAEREHGLEQSLLALEQQAAALRAKSARYRDLLPEAFLLGDLDHGASAQELSAQLQTLERASVELERLEPARKRLEPLVDALRVPPPSADALASAAAQQAELAAERDRVFQLTEALAELSRESPALAWEDAELSLANREQVAPALEQQHARARALLESAEQQVQAAETAWEQTTSDLQKAEAALAAVSAHAARLEHELGHVAAAADLTPEALEAKLSELGAECERMARAERELLAESGAQAERVRQAAHEAARLQRELEVARAAQAPAEASWQALRAEAAAAHVLQAAESSEHDTPRSTLELAAEARSRAELLRDRLAAARGGESLARELGPSALGSEVDFLALWLRVREWLGRRVPAQVAEGEDPLLSLERLRGHLGVLEQRLLHQEADLRGTSEDVARGIEVQLRRAKAQVRRLNQNLSGVSFGSIAAIRVEMRRSAQMEPVLRALGEGNAQELLFQSNLPTEEALSELLKRYGGGRGGGARVLDYREYLELVVEVQRKADASWEPANPTRLSTGEAIGVGAALMMVVLAEWERDANLLRSRRGPGSLRFLFLDEANRLSQDNLGSLFDLCQSLDLQLLIAAPEVARSDGNTTYRLVRKVTAEGREEVIVSGRRALGSEPLGVPAPAPVAVQGQLFDS
jgi:chromosome partition protein MukB